MDILWNSVVRFNRSIIAVPFHSQHFPQLGPISLCDLFLLPNDITCIRADNATIFKNTSCIFTGAAFNPQHDFRIDLFVNKNFSYSGSECIAGFVNTDVGYPPLTRRDNILKYPFFTKKYLDLLPIVKKVLGIKEGMEYAVAHWRRGDQVVKCTDDLDFNGLKMTTKRVRTREDRSINCANSTGFMVGLSGEMMKRIHPEKLPLFTYIATNERSADQMHTLSNSRLKVYQDVRTGLEKIGIHLNALDEFMVEMTLMCDATYFFAWGDSSSHNFYFHCRMLDHSKRHVTVIDDPRCIGNGHNINNYGSLEG